jgi:chemotaxis response regulator CheB
VQQRPKGASVDELVRIIVVQDFPFLASAIARTLESEPDLTVCGIARSGGDAAPLAARVKADVVLLDFRLPDMSGPTAADMIRVAIPSAAIVVHRVRHRDHDAAFGHSNPHSRVACEARD